MDKYYQILGLSPGASDEEIRKAYKKRAFETHPDRNNGQDEEFKKVSEAYSILSGKAQPSRGDYSNPGVEVDPNGFNPFEGFNPFGGMGGFGFNPFGGGIRNKPQRPPVEDHNVRVNLELNVEDIKVGREFGIKYNKSKDCTVCNGIGAKEKNKCKDCEGQGIRIQMRQVGNSMSYTASPCTSCHGYGTIAVDECKHCSGRGYTVETEHLRFEVKERK